MPKIDTWSSMPPGIRQHLIDRMRDRAINIADLNQLRLWIDSAPEVPQGDWYRDFGTFKICRSGSLPKTFLLKGQVAKGKAV
jgi:hypothetical protein